MRMQKEVHYLPGKNVLLCSLLGNHRFLQFCSYKNRLVCEKWESVSDIQWPNDRCYDALTTAKSVYCNDNWQAKHDVCMHIFNSTSQDEKAFFLLIFLFYMIIYERNTQTNYKCIYVYPF